MRNHNSTGRSHPVRNLALMAILVALTVAFAVTPSSAIVCSTPGKDGPGFPTGIINTYYPGTASVSAGATSISVGAARGSATAIASGDLLLVIQMQDADINYSNNNNYGANNGTGSGFTNNNQTGLYEFVKASSAVSGGSVTLATPLVNSYRRRAATTTNGQSTFQVVRVPQYTTAATVGTVTASPWNGASGGIVAMDVAGALSINNDINVNGMGFRGGWGEEAATTGPDTDYRTRITILGNGMKGEGTAGTPNRMNQPTSFNGAPNQVTTGTSLGYPNGTNSDAAKGRGAPGSGGGGGTDGNTANDENSGGGGGGNYGQGGKGGNSWNSNIPVGGEGGAAVPVFFNRIVLGGGGGAGTTNNGTADNTTYSNPAGLACTLTNGECSSGAPGGGIVIIRAQSVSGSGTISARGGSGYNVENDSAGGGGAGGSVVLETQLGGSATVNVSGGDGGNAWRSHTTLIDRHGPGGGGSGGFVAYSPVGLNISATTDGGINGKSCAGDSYGSGGSSGGTYTYQAPNVPGAEPAYACLAKLGKNYSATTIGVSDSSTLTFTITNSTDNPAQSGLAFTDTFPAGLTVTAVSAISGTGCSGTTGFTASTVTLAGGAITAGNATCSFTATVRGDTAGTYVNDSTRFSGTGGSLDTGVTTATLTVVAYDFSITKTSPNTGYLIGDTIDYSVVVRNNGPTSGTVNSVGVVDTLPAELTGVTWTCAAAGGATCVDASGSGNALSTTAHLPLNGTATYTISGTLSSLPGSGSLSNTATVSAPAGYADINAANNSATVTLTAGGSTPGSGNKPLYLYGAAGYELSRTPTPGTPAYITIPELNSRTWTLSPQLATAVTLDPAISSTVPVNLYMASNQARTITATVTLACSAGGPTLTQQLTEALDTTPEIYTPSFALPLGAALTCPAGSTWQLTIRNDTSGSGTRDLRVYPVNGTNLNPAIPNGQISQVILPSRNVINIDNSDIKFYDAAYPGGSVLASVNAGQTVYIRATITDPFGSYDITGATLTLRDPTGAIKPAGIPVAMTAVTPDTPVNATKIYEYSYSVPAAGPAGNWTALVVAREGTESPGVSDNAQAIMPVTIALPLLSILKSANLANANPGQTITYTVQVTNTGTGVGTNVILNDALSPYGAFGINSYGVGVPFFFLDSVPASGLTLGTPEYSFDNGLNWTAVTPPGGINAPAGYNGTVTNWRIPMNGTIRAGGSFTLNYQVMVK